MPNPGPVEAFYRNLVFGKIPGQICPMASGEPCSSPPKRKRGVRRTLGERLANRAHRAEEHAFNFYMMFLRHGTRGITDDEIEKWGEVEATQRFERRVERKRAILDELSRGLHIFRAAMVDALDVIIEEEAAAAAAAEGGAPSMVPPCRPREARPVSEGGSGGSSSPSSAAASQEQDQEVGHGSI